MSNTTIIAFRDILISEFMMIVVAFILCIIPGFCLMKVDYFLLINAMSMFFNLINQICDARQSGVLVKFLLFNCFEYIQLSRKTIQHNHFINIQSCELLLFNLLIEMKTSKISVNEFIFTKIFQFEFIE